MYKDGCFHQSVTGKPDGLTCGFIEFARTVDGQASAALSNQGLKAFEFAAPYRFHVPIAVYVTHLGGISDTHGSDLKKLRLGAAGELYPVSRIGALPKNHPTTIDPCCRHSFRNFVTE